MNFSPRCQESQRRRMLRSPRRRRAGLTRARFPELHPQPEFRTTPGSCFRFRRCPARSLSRQFRSHRRRKPARSVKLTSEQLQHRWQVRAGRGNSRRPLRLPRLAPPRSISTLRKAGHGLPRQCSHLQLRCIHSLAFRPCPRRRQPAHRVERMQPPCRPRPQLCRRARREVRHRRRCRMRRPTRGPRGRRFQQPASCIPHPGCRACQHRERPSRFRPNRVFRRPRAW